MVYTEQIVVNSKPQEKPNIFQYSDYRIYLKDLISYVKKAQKGFTVRNFAKAVGFGSPSFLKMILDGERTLTDSSLEKFCEFFKIKGKEKDYFQNLVHFNQTRDPDDKYDLLIKLNEIRPRTTFSQLEKSQRRFLENDYYIAIREMVLLNDFNEDSKWIAAHCIPRIKPQEARDAIDTLLELGLLKRDKNNKLIQSDPVVDTGYQSDAIEAFAYHEAVLNKARRYLSHLNQEDRNFSALTIPIPDEMESKILEKLYAFQDEILNMVNQEGLTYDHVYQLNFQLFPVTNTSKTKEGDE